MRRYRVYIVSAASMVFLIVAAMLSVGSERYYPLVRVHLPDQSILTFIDVPWTDQQRCLDANRKITDTAGRNCSQCRTEESCATQLDALWQTALAGQAIGLYVVQSGTLRIVVEAAHSAKETCVAMAEQITRDKNQPARCMPPK